MTARALGTLFAVLSLAAGAAPGQAVAGQASPSAAASSPLALRVMCSGRGDTASLHVQIANTSGRDAAVVLGFTPANSQVHVVDALDVFVVRVATGADEDYVYVNPKYALASGAPWVVSIPAGKTYETDLAVKDFISRLNYTNLDVSVAAGGRLVLDARPAGKSGTRVWTGMVETRIDACE